MCSVTLEWLDVCDGQWLSVAVRGCPWLSVAVRGCPWLSVAGPWQSVASVASVAVRGCPWLSVAPVAPVPIGILARIKIGGVTFIFAQLITVGSCSVTATGIWLTCNWTL